MSKLKDRFARLTFRSQMILMMVSVTVLLMSLLGTLLYQISKRTLEENYKNTHEYNMELFSSSIQLRFGTIIAASRDLIENTSFMTVLEEDEGKHGYFTAPDQAVVENALLNVEYNNNYINGIVAISKNGSFRYVKKSLDSDWNVRKYYESGDILEQSWIAVADAAKGKEVFFGYDVLDEESTSLFSMVKRMNRPGTNTLVGYLVINIKKEMINETFGTKTDSFKNNQYLIFDRNPRKFEEPGKLQVVYSNLSEGKLEEVVEDYQNQEQSGHYIFSEYQDRTSGWVIVSVLPKSDISSQSDYIMWMMLLGILLLGTISIAAANIISRAINRPLKTLEDTIEEVGRGNYKLDVVFDESEIGKVGQNFISMVSNNVELRERLLTMELQEKEAELLLLQTQINPHFLYNTLDALYFMAVIKKADDIAEMVKALSDTFKLSLNKGEKLIKVESEIEKIKAYIRIQNLRYNNRFTFVMEVEEEMLQEKILSFILQPVVENAVYHGLEGKIGVGKISLTGFIEEDFLIFIIEDNGIGISDFSSLEKGYGVKNIQQRIEIFYGDEFRMLFESEEGIGTRVTYKLPRLKEGFRYEDRNY
ncbi:MAG: sensor histidine kinase [Lachnospiraceae bacterium]